MKITFAKLGINGEGIGYTEEKKPVFCSGVYPGDTALVKIIEEHDHYAKAQLTKILDYSKERVRSACPHDRRCQACPLLRMDYKAQLKYKKQMLDEALWKYGRVSDKLIRDMHESPLTSGYRNQLKLPVREYGGVLKTGMYLQGTNHFVETDGCLMHDPELEKVRGEVMKLVNAYEIKAYDTRSMKGLRYLILRGIDHQFMVCFITGRDELSEGFINAVSAIDGMTTVSQSINTAKKANTFFGSKVKVLKGEEHMTVHLKDIDLQLSPDSFFQLNKPQAERLYELAIQKIDPCDSLVEAYCGVGAMSIMAADKAKSVIGIESVEAAVNNAEANALLNHVDDHVRFLCKDASEGMQYVLSRKNVDVLLADPPRSGMDEAMINTILSSSIRKIVYISCNPATLGKNIKDLKKEYDVRTVIPFDMFPGTPHIESITVLERRGMKMPRVEKKKRIRNKH